LSAVAAAAAERKANSSNSLIIRCGMGSSILTSDCNCYRCQPLNKIKKG